jgi:hypothetical protein
MRQKNQVKLNLGAGAAGEARNAATRDVAFIALGLPSRVLRKPNNPPNRRVLAGMPGGAGGAAP